MYIAGITEVPLKYAIVEQKVNSEKRIVRQVRRASIKNLIQKRVAVETIHQG